MKISVTGIARAYALANLLPDESWEKGLVTMAQGPIMAGKETFVFDIVGMRQSDAIALMRQVTGHLSIQPSEIVPVRPAEKVLVRDEPFDWSAIDTDYLARGISCKKLFRDHNS